MSRRRDPRELDPEPVEPEPDPVEYFVDEDADGSSRTVVPNSVQESHSSSSAPSTFVAVSDDFSAPHISHWGIRALAGTVV